jgi:hypothetical protein
MSTSRAMAFGAAGILVFATLLTGFVLDIVFWLLAIGIVFGAFKFLK